MKRDQREGQGNDRQREPRREEMQELLSRRLLVVDQLQRGHEKEITNGDGENLNEDGRRVLHAFGHVLRQDFHRQMLIEFGGETSPEETDPKNHETYDRIRPGNSGIEDVPRDDLDECEHNHRHEKKAEEESFRLAHRIIEFQKEFQKQLHKKAPPPVQRRRGSNIVLM